MLSTPTSFSFACTFAASQAVRRALSSYPALSLAMLEHGAQICRTRTCCRNCSHVAVSGTGTATFLRVAHTRCFHRR